MTQARTRILSSLAIVTVLAATAGTAQASTYFPNRPGDTYRYKDMRFGGEQTASVTRTSGGWRYWTEFGGLGPLWVWTDSSSEAVYIWNVDHYELFCDFSEPVGSTFALGLRCNVNARIAAKNQTLTVAAGTFGNVTELELSASCADAGVVSIAFARGVGPVQFTQQSIAGPVTHELVAGTIGGVVYPQAVTAFEVKGTTDTYRTKAAPGGTPKVVNAYIEVTNRSGASIEYWAGRPYFDVEVHDANGNVVSRWSRGRMFTMELRRLVLADGQTWYYGGPVELTNDQGAPLAAGDYKVVVRLRGAFPFSVSFPLTIEP